MEKGLAKTIGDRYRDLSLVYAEHGVETQRRFKKLRKLQKKIKSLKAIPPERRLKFLISMCEKGDRIDFDLLKKRRKFYSKNKQVLLPIHKGTMCYVCNVPAIHRHHVKMLAFGGENMPENLVTLCENCHSAIHPWMQEQENSKPENGLDELKQILQDNSTYSSATVWR